MKDLTNLLTEESAVQELIDRAFEEDVGSGDVTTDSIVDEAASAEAIWISREKGTIAGLDIARSVFQKMDPQLEWNHFIEDGNEVENGNKIVTMKGSCRVLLTVERIALNIIQRMSGIATMTSKYVRAIGDYSTKILDTRKTVPGLRLLDKYAVAAGGGENHRLGLFDLALIKDNHIIAAGGITEAMYKVRAKHPDLRIEVETTTLDQVKEALSGGADIIMLDNMNNKQMEKAVSLIKDKAEIEASGNITLANVREVAQTGVDYISVGALTHSVKAFDISQKLQKIFK
jgi:nicotinate-nucleotide pyrophosphorylase (carboxylating)